MLNQHAPRSPPFSSFPLSRTSLPLPVYVPPSLTLPPTRENTLRILSARWVRKVVRSVSSRHPSSIVLRTCGQPAGFNQVLAIFQIFAKRPATVAEAQLDPLLPLPLSLEWERTPQQLQCFATLQKKRTATVVRIGRQTS